MSIKTSNSFHTEFIHILQIEIDAIREVVQKISSEETSKSMEYLLNCKGKIVLLGVGKSGIIAKKIAATLSSTGSPSIFIHAGEAMHGDLGILQEHDVVITLSNSGETEEIISLLPHIKLRNLKIIAIVGNINSTLARKADAVLDASVSREACPLNLAPTTSTTVALAVGDALAMTLMQAKNIKPEDFAINHPAGKLGKRLALKIEDLMHSNSSNPTINGVTRWNEILLQIEQGKLGAVNVVDERNMLQGIITDGDVRRAINKYSVDQLHTLKAEDILTRQPVVVAPETLAYSALQLMEKRSSQIAVLPVVNHEGICLGMVRIHDIVGKL